MREWTAVLGAVLALVLGAPAFAQPLHQDDCPTRFDDALHTWPGCPVKPGASDLAVACQGRPGGPRKAESRYRAGAVSRLNVEAFTYDGQNRLVGSTFVFEAGGERPEGVRQARARFGYDTGGRLCRVEADQDGDGTFEGQVNREEDEKGRLIEEREGQRIWRYRYDDQGLLRRAEESLGDRRGSTVRFVLHRGRLLRSIREKWSLAQGKRLPGEATRTRYAYDPVGRLVTVTEVRERPGGTFRRLVKLAYDREGRLVKLSSQTKGVTATSTFEYGAGGWLVRRVDTETTGGKEFKAETEFLFAEPKVSR